MLILENILPGYPKRELTGKYGKNGKTTLAPQYLLMSIEWF
jgi:hypothetical protein